MVVFKIMFLKMFLWRYLVFSLRWKLFGEGGVFRINFLCLIFFFVRIDFLILLSSLLFLLFFLRLLMNVWMFIFVLCVIWLNKVVENL